MKTKLQLSILTATALLSLGAVANAQQVPQAPNTTFFVTSAGPGKGMVPLVTAPPADLQTYVKSEIVRWGDVVRRAGVAGSE